MSVVHNTLNNGSEEKNGAGSRSPTPSEYARRETALRQRIRALENDVQRLTRERDAAGEALEAMKRSHHDAQAKAEALHEELMGRVTALEQQLALQPSQTRFDHPPHAASAQESPSLLRQAQTRNANEE